MARGRIRQYEFTVSGSGVFPFDMLRYDACYPAHESQVTRMDSSNRSLRTVGHRSIEMRSPLKSPTIDRWKSFGWDVTDIKAIRA